MLNAISLKEMLMDLRERVKTPTECVGIVFARPSSKVVKERVLCDIEYFHHRAGKYINFYFAGYGAYWDTNEYIDKIDVCSANGVMWSFSSNRFSKFVDELESISKWEYGGGAELLLLEYVSGMLDFSRIVLLPIDEIVENSGTQKLSNIMENIIRGYRKNTDIEMAVEILKELGLDKYAIIRDLTLDTYKQLRMWVGGRT